MNVCYLSGGVGGARLLHGLARTLPASSLAVIVNVGDDFDHFGLRICPDLDTVLYMLSGLSDTRRGWGVRGDTFRALELVKRYGGEDWFQLGDRDLATHLMRTQWLARGETLTAVTAKLARALDVECAILPMSDQRFETHIETESEGVLSFQHWLVRRRGEPRVRRVLFRGEAQPTREVLAAIDSAQLVVIGPSNPYVSVDPILALPGVREKLAKKRVVAISPIVGGRAIKGPLAEMIPSLAQRAASAGAVAAHYEGMLSGFVVEHGDEASVQDPRPRVLATQTIMQDARDRARLAHAVLAFAETLL
jgi:LPPG:FO 2-phospho-L-lactate transferase